ncbi:MAG: hypothetical protein HQ517_15190 [SAR324 cluster bacterium]|nr:hypothetical protein [SAR324 cluster bacterium]
MGLQSCVTPQGRFQWGIHRPQYRVVNFRESDEIGSLGTIKGGTKNLNQLNFPPGTVDEMNADWIFEIPNAFPFRGTTYICKSWADGNAADPTGIHLPERPAVSFRQSMGQWFADEPNSVQNMQRFINTMPDPLRIALASISTDPVDLVCLAKYCCEFDYDKTGSWPLGLRYRENSQGVVSACITDKALFEVLVNNRDLPDVFKEVMVLRPGVQGKSEIIGDWRSQESGSHVFEYLRRNSYIPWGHHAANMADDAVRYDIHSLNQEDMTGLRHLYYQRTFARLAQQCRIEIPAERRVLSVPELEMLREEILKCLSEKGAGEFNFNRTLWGWNFGFDFAPSLYRLHASHQQVHQQFALIPSSVPVQNGDTLTQTSAATLSAFGCGDLIADFTRSFRDRTGCCFFESYIQALRSNRRMDDQKNGSSSLIIYEDCEVLLFVPKAQTSQWEIQLMTLKTVGNILEADTTTRQSIDRAMLIAMKVLSAMGASMITTIEYPKQFDSIDRDQRLLYAFLPKLPESPGAFSEAQLRWINGHYPEDFALACRAQLSTIGV